MESKKLIIAFVWTFVLASIVIISLEGGGMTFGGYLIFFLIALTSTAAVEALMPGAKQPGSELQRELEGIRSRLDELQAESGRSP
ncbi:hypothetical protein HQ586_09490 [Candidatus Bathyarchaeota archaeon]|nr:hypothetical protein [Candidatus Bathyarchaeota archaeon]